MTHDDLCVTRVPIFQGLTRRELVDVAALARPVAAGKGETVYAPGQPVSRLLVVHSGRLKISSLAPGGQEQILRTAAEGDVVGERTFLTGHRPDHFAVALEDSRMCVFDHDDLGGLLRDHPDIGLRMLRTLSDRLASVERLLAAVTSSDVTARVAAYLLDLPAAVRDGTPEVRLPMAKKDVAAYLGTTPESLSRSLAGLAADGAIELRGRRGVGILDVGALDRAAVSR
ncbi:Crp/Fnr family transcriptional regulator [Actinomadura sp. GC306]|uniref:Crp/Fnr family transcriptional regulator n=1 Tax=Actinomadura sp. GC306 TaxID=2530367 RepID=UPI00104A558A|nr:Crp/Fnr family transcriptional regulator [Actinomadura sp. GC306]TDC61746.1 Crp/Fnr family transcriptional regulator [Actinomadura sp. GC306]